MAGTASPVKDGAANGDPPTRSTQSNRGQTRRDVRILRTPRRLLSHDGAAIPHNGSHRIVGSAHEERCGDQDSRHEDSMRWLGVRSRNAYERRWAGLMPDGTKIPA